MSDDLSDHQWHVVSLSGTPREPRLYVDGDFSMAVFGRAITREMLSKAIGDPLEDEA